MKSLGSFGGDLNVKTPFWLVTGTNTELTPRNKVIIAWRIQQPGSQHLLFCRKMSVTRTIPQPTQWCWASWLCRTVSPPVPTEFPFISSGSFQQVQPVQRMRASRLVGKQTTKTPKYNNYTPNCCMAWTGSQESKFLIGGEKTPNIMDMRLEESSNPVSYSYKWCFHTLAVLQVLNSTLAAIPPSTPCCWSKAAHEYNRGIKLLVHMQSASFRLNTSGFLQQNSSLLACPWCISISVSSRSHLDTVFLDYKKLALPSLLPTLSR